MDLDSAAGEALARLREAEAEMERAKSGMNQADGDVRRLSEQLASDWASFDESVDALLQRARSARESLDATGGQTSQALSEMQQGITTGLRETAGEAAREAEHVVAALEVVERAALASAPEAASNGDALAGQGLALAERAAALAAEVDATFVQLQQFLAQDVVDGLRSMEKEARELAGRLRTEIFEATAHDLAAAQEALDRHLCEVDDSLSAALEDATEHLPAVVDCVASDLKAVHEKRVEALLTVSSTLDNALHDAEAAVSAQVQAVQAAAQTVAQRVSGTEQTAASAIEALTSVRNLLRSYTSMG